MSGGAIRHQSLHRVGANLLTTLLDTVLPASCPACLQRPGPALCDDCRQGLLQPPHPCPRCAAPRIDEETSCPVCGGRGRPPLRTICAHWTYHGTLRRLIHRAKGGSLPAALDTLCRLLPSIATPPADTMVVPIPPANWRQSGPHLTTALARTLARRGGCRLVRALRWNTVTCPQHRLGLRDRRRNMRGSLATTVTIAGPVLLVDDILTTGATLVAAGEALRAAGADTISAVCLARSPDWRDPAIASEA